MTKDQETAQLDAMMMLFKAGYETTCNLDGTVTVKDPFHGYDQCGRYGIRGFDMVKIKDTAAAHRFLQARS